MLSELIQLTSDNVRVQL